MALTKEVVKLSESEAVVKVYGNDATPLTITLDSLVSSTQSLSGTRNVTISGVQWTGAPGACYFIKRNGVIVMTLLADNGNFIDMAGTYFPPDTSNSSSDISVTIAKADGTTAVQGELWLRLRKSTGYASKIETALFGIYDNTTAVGS